MSDINTEMAEDVLLDGVIGAPTPTCRDSCPLRRRGVARFVGTHATNTHDGHQVRTTTPTGHTYRSLAPPPPGSRPWSVIEIKLNELMLVG